MGQSKEREYGTWAGFANFEPCNWGRDGWKGEGESLGGEREIWGCRLLNFSKPKSKNSKWGKVGVQLRIRRTEEERIYINKTG